MLVSQRFNQRIVGRQLGGVRFSGQDCSGDSVTAFAFDVPNEVCKQICQRDRDLVDTFRFQSVHRQESDSLSPQQRGHIWHATSAGQVRNKDLGSIGVTRFRG